MEVAAKVLGQSRWCWVRAVGAERKQSWGETRLTWLGAAPQLLRTPAVPTGQPPIQNLPHHQHDPSSLLSSCLQSDVTKNTESFVVSEVVC